MDALVRGLKGLGLRSSALARVNVRQQVHTSACSWPLTSTPAFKTPFRALSSTASAADIPPFTLNTIRAPPQKKKRRIARGAGSGRGKTAGRGHKGQLSRSGTGKPGVGFEGGQIPIFRRIPKRGFVPRNRQELDVINLFKLQAWIDEGRIDTSSQITMKELLDSGICGRSIKHGVKLLGDGKLTAKIDIEVSAASQSAIEAIEAAGGSIVTRYYNRLGLRSLLKPEKFPGGLPELARPPPRKARYYLKAENRGYLAQQEA